MASDIAGLDLGSSVIQTNTGLTGTPPPLILIYATADTMVSTSGNIATGTLTRETGSADSFAVREDTNSKLITGNLVMGNYADVSSAFGATALAPAALTLGQFTSAVTGSTSNTSTQSLASNPAGLIDLISPLNRVTNLTAVLDGSGGINFNNSANLTVGTIGGTDDSGEIDGAGIGAVAITVAVNRNLTLTNTSAITGDTSDLPVIATSGGGAQITLTTSGAGVFTNAADYSSFEGSVTHSLVGTNGGIDSGTGGSALDAEASQYIIYAHAPAQADLNGLEPSVVFDTPPGTLTEPDGDTVAYAVSESGTTTPTNTPNLTGPLSSFPSFKYVNDALYSIVPIQQPDGILDPNIIGGAGGVANDRDLESDVDLRRRLEKKFGAARAAELFAIIREDEKDGSTVNTGMIGVKWAANTGLSKLVRMGEFGLLSQGLSRAATA